MAHQAHAICWNVLAANLRYRLQTDFSRDEPSDIVFRFKPQQDKQIGYFAESFAGNVAEHTRIERQKYPDKYEVPSPDDIIINDSVATKINRTVYRARLEPSWRRSPPVKWSPHLCPHRDDTSKARDDEPPFTCKCPLPFTERKFSALVHKHVPFHSPPRHWYGCYYTGAEAYLNIEPIKILLLYGEMDPILRLCAHPYVTHSHSEWWNSECQWEVLYLPALDAYLVLNIIHCFPELWDPGSGCRRQQQRSASDPNGHGPLHKEDEYRNTAVYQRLVRSCTTQAALSIWDDPRFTTPIADYPHQQFFGIPKGQWRENIELKRGFRWPAFMRVFKASREYKPVKQAQFPFGQVPFDLFLSCGEPAPHMPDKEDVNLVSGYLRAKGLPQELILEVFDLAEYDLVQRRLRVAHDPFHPENRRELEKYLNYCWLTLVRCNMFANALGLTIDWKKEVTESLGRVLGNRNLRWGKDP